MYPVLKPGDVVITRPKSVGDIRVGEKLGDIVVFTPKYFFESGIDSRFLLGVDKNTPIIHRAIHKEKRYFNEKYSIITYTRIIRC